MTGTTPTVPAAPSGPVFTRRPTVVGVLSGISEMALGAAFIITWVDYRLLGFAWVKFALELMLLEFILVHSGPFLGMAGAIAGDERKRRLALGGLALMYSVFVLGFCLSLDSWRPMITFWVVTAQRLAAHLVGPPPSDESKAWFLVDVALSAVLYLGLVMLTLFVPIPKLGIGGSLSGMLHTDSGGIWVDQPQKVVVLAGLYYLIRGWATANAYPRQTAPAATG